MEFQDIVRNRYATKSFDGKKLPQNKVDNLLEMVRLSPSSFNIQPWMIKIVEDQDTKNKLAPLSWNQPQVTTCSHLLIFCANTDIAGNITKIEKAMQAAGIPQEKITPYITMMRDFEKMLTPEQKLSWAQHQVYIALGNALNGATSLGFDSCPMEGFDPKGYSEILKLPSHLVPTVLCPIGYGNDTPLAQKQRFPLKDIIF